MLLELLVRGRLWVLPWLSALRIPDQRTAETNKNSERVIQVTAKTFPVWASDFHQKVMDTEIFGDPTPFFVMQYINDADHLSEDTTL